MAALVEGRSLDQEKKREILLYEIEHWRRSRLLPEQYCDFLSNLYREDENVTQSQSRSNTGLLYLSSTGTRNRLDSWFCHYFLDLFDRFLFYRFSVSNANILGMCSNRYLLRSGRCLAFFGKEHERDAEHYGQSYYAGFGCVDHTTSSW
jgi:hypothetical protein